MKEFVITTDSTVDLPKEFLAEKQVDILRLSYVIDGTTYEDMGELSCKEFMDKIRAGAMPTTSQVNPEQARKMFEPIVKEGKDILHIAFTSGLSGTYNSERIAAEELMEEYEDAKIVVIDSLCASMGQGMLLYKALELKEAGKPMDEIVTWVEANKLNVCHTVAIDDLYHLHRGGRVSKTSAVVGSMIGIKPILQIDDNGKLVVISKERGRKKSLVSLINRMEQQMQGFENDMAMIVHGDCEEDAQFLKKQMKERFGIEKVIINGIGAVIGSHTGPGVIAVFFMGEKIR